MMQIEDLGKKNLIAQLNDQAMAQQDKTETEIRTHLDLLLRAFATI